MGMSLNFETPHPLQYCVNLSVPYRIRNRNGGKIVYLNKELLFRLGFISNPDSPVSASDEIEFLQEFNLVIVNEHDLKHKTIEQFKNVKPYNSFATRYLQLQHFDRTGGTSGDGRSVWLGQKKDLSNKTYDIIGRGTGATRLSVGYQLKKDWIATGDPKSYYGSGIALDRESIHTAMISRRLKEEGLEAEETLAIIKYAKGKCVLIKAGQNLIRPAHFLAASRQKDWERFEFLTHYQIRKVNEIDDSVRNTNELIQFYIENLAKKNALYSAANYWVWQDWDGDNILFNTGLLDLSTFCAMGACYHEYRIDDVSTVSTGLLEQTENAFKTAKELLLGFKSCFPKLEIDVKKYLNSAKTLYENQLSIEHLRMLGIPRKVAQKILDRVRPRLITYLEKLSQIEQYTDDKPHFALHKGFSKQVLFSRDKFYLSQYLLGTNKVESVDSAFRNALIDPNFSFVKSNYSFLLEKFSDFYSEYGLLMSEIQSAINLKNDEMDKLRYKNIMLYSGPLKATGLADQEISKLLYNDIQNKEYDKFNRRINFYFETQRVDLGIGDLCDSEAEKLDQCETEVLNSILKNRYFV